MTVWQAKNVYWVSPTAENPDRPTYIVSRNHGTDKGYGR
jgi:hypothetical protein